MTDFVKPKILSSRCLGFAPCRYNGQTIPNELVDSLMDHAEFFTPCPEFEIGLGVPRDPIRIVRMEGTDHLVQPSTGLDVTEKMRQFCTEYLGSLDTVDAVLLKADSPSCGLETVKIHSRADRASVVGKGDGFFARALKERFPGIIIEDENRLRNPLIRHHFLAKAFATASLRRVGAEGGMGTLVDFHAGNKLLLMSYSQTHLSMLGRIVANHGKKSFGTVFDEYRHAFLEATAKGSRHTNIVNAMIHAFGYFKGGLSPEEKQVFLNTVDMYREGRSSLDSCLSILTSYIVRFEQPYLAQQTFFNPYPQEIRGMFECSKRRDYWK